MALPVRQRITWPPSSSASGEAFSEESEIDLFETLLPTLKVVFLAGVELETVRKMVKLAKPDVEFHVFEPDLPTFQEFRKVPFGRNIFLNPFALSATAGTVPYYSADQTCVKTGKVPPIKVRADTIENYCQIRRVARIDFLKLNTGGWEYPIVVGAGLVPLMAVEFVYGPGWKVAGRKLEDIFQLLAAKGTIFEVFAAAQLQPRMVAPAGLDYRVTHYLFKSVNPSKKIDSNLGIKQ